MITTTARTTISVTCLFIATLLFTPHAFAQTELDLVTWWGEGSPFYPAYKAIVDDFNAQSADIKVNLLTLTGLGNRGALDKLVTMVASGAAPPLAAVDVWWIPLFRDLGAIVPLDELERLGDVDFSDMYDGIREAVEYRGKVYAAPMHVGTLALYYNIDLFNVAGIDASAGPENWAELASVGRKLTVDKNGDDQPEIWGINPPGGWVRDTFLWQNGGEYFDESMTAPAFHGPEGIEALEFWVDAIHGRRFAPPLGNRGDFRKGTTAMHIAVNALGTNLVADGLFEFGAGVLPGKVKRATNLGGWHLAVFDTDQKEAAYAFIEYVMRPDVYAKYLATIGYLPARRSVLDEPVYQEYLERTPWFGAFIDSLPYIHARPGIAIWNELSGIVYKHYDAALKGEVPAKTALEAAAQEWKPVLDNYYSKRE